MVRPLFFEYPNDPGSWTIDDEYMFGSDLLVAPMFASGDRRKVYLPPGTWIDYQSGRVYEGAKWHDIPLGPDSSCVAGQESFGIAAHQGRAKYEERWTGTMSSCAFLVPTMLRRRGSSRNLAAMCKHLSLVPRGRVFALREDPQAGKVKWEIKVQTLVR